MTDSGHPPRLFFENTYFPLSKSMPQFLQSIRSGRCGALRFPTLDYQRIRQTLNRSLGEEYGKGSRPHMDLTAAVLHCTGCLWKFPESYCNSLFLGDMMEDALGSEKDEAPGARAFAETGLCPLCGGSESVLIYEYYQPDNIEESDVQSIQHYWHQQALEWWRIAGDRELHCSQCNALIPRDSGSLLDRHFLCESCTGEELAGALQKLRRYPHALGNNLLRRARLRQEA
jgi:hypothetical protein